MDKEKALDMLRMLHGDAPHNHGGNICRGDGYFAQSIVREFGMSVSDLGKAVGYRSDDDNARATTQALEDSQDRCNTLMVENEALRIELRGIKRLSEEEAYWLAHASKPTEAMAMLREYGLIKS